MNAHDQGEKPTKAALDSDLPKPILDTIREAKKYVEGRAVRIPVRSEADVDPAERIASLKMET